MLCGQTLLSWKQIKIADFAPDNEMSDLSTHVHEGSPSVTIYWVYVIILKFQIDICLT